MSTRGLINESSTEDRVGRLSALDPDITMEVIQSEADRLGISLEEALTKFEKVAE